MHHKVVLTVGTVKARPYHAQCACSSAGDFQTEEKAVNWYKVHVSRIGVVETHELYVPGAHKAPAQPPKQEAKK